MENGARVVQNSYKYTKALLRDNEDIQYAPFSRTFLSEAGFVFNY